MTVQYTDISGQNRLEGLPLEGLKTPLPSVISKRKYLELILGTPEEFIKQLNLSPKEYALIRSDIEREGLTEAFMRPLIFAEHAGIPVHQAYRWFNGSIARYGGVGWFLNDPEVARQYRASIIPDHVRVAGLPEIKPFAGTVIEVSRYFAQYRHDTDFRYVKLHLPDREWTELLCNSDPGSHQTERAFAYIRYKHLDHSRIEVLEVNSEVYDYIRNPEIKERYKDWPHVLLRAFLETVRHSKPFHSNQTEDPDKLDSALKEPARFATVIFPSPSQMMKVYPAKEKAKDSDYGRIKVFNSDDPEDVTYKVPGLSKKSAQFLYRDLPTLYGFAPASFDLKLSELPEHSLKRALARDIAFLTSKADRDPLFQFQRKPARMREWISLYLKTLDNAPMYLPTGTPIPLAYPRKPVTPPEAARHIYEACELVPSIQLQEKELPCNTETRSQRLKELRAQKPQIKQIQDLIPSGFSLISKGIGHGPSSTWWEIPEHLSGPTARVIHLKDQNRHPSVRLYDVDSSGHTVLVGSLGYKGGGLGSLEGATLSKPYKRRLPFYYREDDTVIREGKKHRIAPFGGHRLWGGSDGSGVKDEFLASADLALFCDRIGKEALEGVALPISVERYMSIPSWPFSGGTEWHDPCEYQRSFMSEKLATFFSSAVLFSHSDVRLSQLVSPVIMTGEAPKSITEIEENVVRALKFLYFTHNEKLIVGDVELRPGNTFGIQNIGSFLQELGEQNKDSAQRIFDGFVKRSLSCLAAVHGSGSSFGGLKRNGSGIIFGGPQSIRNIDLYGTIHDYETIYAMSWSTNYRANEALYPRETSNLNFLQAADALLWKESTYWLHSILFGFSSHTAVGAERVKLDSKQDITVLTDNRSASEHLRRSVEEIKSTPDVERIIEDEAMVEMYRDYRLKGRAAFNYFEENPI